MRVAARLVLSETCLGFAACVTITTDQRALVDERKVLE
jgi:hypothetical protein